MNTRNENLALMLAALRNRGLACALDDNAECVVTGKKSRFTDEVEAWLEFCRESLTEALRIESGLCIACGMEEAKHPLPYGWMPVRGEDGRILMDDDGKTHRKKVALSEAYIQTYCRLWCEDCWNSSSMDREARLAWKAELREREKANAESRSKTIAAEREQTDTLL